MEVGLARETSHEDGSDTKNDPLLSLSIATSEPPMLQAGVTNMHGQHNLHFRAWGL